MPKNNKYNKKHIDVVSRIYNTIDDIPVERETTGIMMQLMSEVGELTKAMRESNDDGVLGEACDVLITLMDLVKQSGFSINDIERTTGRKLSKWIKRTEEYAREDRTYDVIEFEISDSGIKNYNHIKAVNRAQSADAAKNGIDVIYAMDDIDNRGETAICSCNSFDDIYIVVPSSKIGKGFRDILFKELTEYVNKKGILSVKYDMKEIAVRSAIVSKNA